MLEGEAVQRITSLKVILIGIGIASVLLSSSRIATVHDGSFGRRLSSISKKRFLQLQQSGGGEKRSIGRSAIVRPFSLLDVDLLPSFFDSWDEHFPCAKDVQEKPDLILAFSQTYTATPKAVEQTKFIQKKYFHDSSSWGFKCFNELKTIEADIPMELDLYEPSLSQSDHNWVNGPNRQFISVVQTLTSLQYETIYLMEGDSIPIKNGWFDSLYSEMKEKAPFAILGSKYDGDSWKNFEKQLPSSLINHLNGNALYNLTHPLLQKLVRQLDSEKDSIYNAVPYDYRISQILYQGFDGSPPKLPSTLVDRHGEKNYLEEKKNSKLFSKWWNKYVQNAETNPMKESQIISNLAATNIFSDSKLNAFQKKDASIIHGAKYYLPFVSTGKSKEDGNVDPEISLVISEFYNSLSSQILSDLALLEKQGQNIFSKIIVMLPSDIDQNDLPSSDPLPSNVKFQHRSSHSSSSSAYKDLCNAEVDTEWFMLTNSFHSIQTGENRVPNLLSTYDEELNPSSSNTLTDKDRKKRPIIPYIHATEHDCFQYEKCLENFVIARKYFDPSLKVVVQDDTMLFNTQVRNSFCEDWEEKFLSKFEKKHQKKDIGPTATSYLAYLNSNGKEKKKANELYEFTDRSLYGARSLFTKMFLAEEKAAQESGKITSMFTRGNGVTGGRRMEIDYGTDDELLNYSYNTNGSPVQSPLNPTRSEMDNDADDLSYEVDDELLHSEEGLLSQDIQTDDMYGNEDQCSDFCYVVNVPWYADNKKDDHKCAWKYSCAECPECGGYSNGKGAIAQHDVNDFNSERTRGGNMNSSNTSSSQEPGGYVPISVLLFLSCVLAGVLCHKFDVAKRGKAILRERGMLSKQYSELSSNEQENSEGDPSEKDNETEKEEDKFNDGLDDDFNVKNNIV